MTVPRQRSQCPDCGRVVYEYGGIKMIEAARLLSGESPADDFLRQMEERRKPDYSRLADVAVRLEELVLTGSLEIPRELNRLTDDLSEIKARDVRLPFFYLPGSNERVVRLTSGFLKGTQKTPRHEIRKAQLVREEDLRQ